MRHQFIPLHIAEGVSAACTCNWSSAYTHAYEKYALEDWEFHVEGVNR